MSISNENLKIRLAAMSFMQFAVWGCYLISLGNFLSHVGLSRQIGWFYGVQCVVSLFMPAAVGYIADRWMDIRRVLCICDLSVALFMGSAALYAMTAATVSFWPLFTLYALGVASFMPTVALTNSFIFKSLRSRAVNPEPVFPTLRLFGTVGFIVGMLVVNFCGIQSSPLQLALAAVISLVAAVNALTLPTCGASVKEQGTVLWTKALTMFRSPVSGIFFVFCILVGVALQVTNSFGNVYISQFGSLPQFVHTWGARNANAIIAVSQVSEVLCMFLLPFCLRKMGIRTVIMTAIFAWSLRFFLLAAGDTGGGLWLLICSGLVYGVAFDFFNIACNLYVDRLASPSLRSSAQGLFMAMSGGVGGALGLFVAQCMANGLVFSQAIPAERYSGWISFWMIFAAYTLVVGVLYFIWIKFSSGSGDSKLCRNRSRSDSGTN